MTSMNLLRKRATVASSTTLAAALALTGGVIAFAADDKPADAANARAARPALTVTVATPQRSRWPVVIAANGNVAAWQDASIGVEAQGLRLTEVLAGVGDRVRRGQLLARLSSDTLAADVAASRAGVVEAEANQAEAAANAERARQLQASGAISAQQIQQYVTAEATAQARAASLRAQLRAAEVRLAQTRIVAPDDGVISSRSATVGAVLQPGQELFRLIRGNRLEWRAEVPSSDLVRLQAGQPVQVAGAAGPGRVRMVAPTVDPATRNGVVYVDLPQPGPLKAGMFARGEFAVGEREGLTLPAAAVVLRDGFHWVFVLGAGDRVAQRKVTVGARVGDRIEITGGLAADARVVEQGAGFLAEGDTVRVAAATR
jgi:RND family efflux transporter MFP subunit